MAQKKGQAPQTKKGNPPSTSPIARNPKKKAASKAQWYSHGAGRIIIQFLKPLVFVGVVFILIISNKGYERLYNFNFVRLFNDMKRYKGLSYDEKERLFFPASYPLFDMIKEQTPEDAIILIPPKEIWYPKEKKLGLGQWMNREDYLTYFLYPRRLLIDDKQGAKSPLMKEITHVLIVDSWGYDKLPYEVSNPQAYAVLPINR